MATAAAWFSNFLEKQIVRRLNVAGVGVYWEIGFQNQAAGQNFTVYSYDALWRRRRLVGRAAV